MIAKLIAFVFLVSIAQCNHDQIKLTVQQFEDEDCKRVFKIDPEIDDDFPNIDTPEELNFPGLGEIYVEENGQKIMQKSFELKKSITIGSLSTELKCKADEVTLSFESIMDEVSQKRCMKNSFREIFDKYVESANLDISSDPELEMINQYLSKYAIYEWTGDCNGPQESVTYKLNIYSDDQCTMANPNSLETNTRVLGKEYDHAVSKAECKNGNILTITTSMIPRDYKYGECQHLDGSGSGISAYVKVTWSGACGGKDDGASGPVNPNSGNPGPSNPGSGGSGNSSGTDSGKKISVKFLKYKDKDCNEALEGQENVKAQEVTLGEEGTKCENGDTLVTPDGKFKNDKCTEVNGTYVKVSWTGACTGMDQVLMWGLIGGGGALVLLALGLACYCKNKQ